jgi:AcrR family transcriptional regulator
MTNNNAHGVAASSHPYNPFMPRPPASSTPAKPGRGATGTAPATAEAVAPRRRSTDTRQRILNAAEQLFAEKGYEGCALRDIALKAKVNQGMIHYFFKTKETLFREAYVQRGQEIADERLRLLNEEEAIAGAQAISTQRLLELFLTPAFDVGLRGTGGRAFVRILSRLHLDASRFVAHIRGALYDESSRRFVSALAKSLPHLSADEVAWRFVFVLGTYQYALADTGRLEVISDGQCGGKDFREALRQMMPFLVSGLNAPPPEQRQAEGSAGAPVARRTPR